MLWLQFQKGESEVNLDQLNTAGISIAGSIVLD